MMDLTIKSFVRDGKYIVGCYLPTLTPVRFKDSWGAHTFTDEEIVDLLAGKQISFRAYNQMGYPYMASGSLQEQELRGCKFWHFKLYMGSVPAVWQGHVFTDEEIETLNNGGSVELHDCISKKNGRRYSCMLSFGEKDGERRLIPDFSKRF